MRVAVEAIHASLSPTAIIRGDRGPRAQLRVGLLGPLLTRTITVAGQELWSRCTTRDPEAATIVYLHDALGAHTSWATMPALLASKLPFPTRSIVYDRLGHGTSTGCVGYGTNLHSRETDRLRQLLSMLRVTGKLMLVGHSDGATIALEYGASVSRVALAGLFLIAPHIVMEVSERDAH